MLIKSSNKMDATKAFINTWLKDTTLYCNYCGMDYYPVIVKTDEGTYEKPCCENPQIGRNLDHTKGCVEQNKEIRNDMIKSTGAIKDDSMRLGVSMPPRLYTDLKKYFEGYGEKFLDTPKELHAFMRNFPMFTVPRSI